MTRRGHYSGENCRPNRADHMVRQLHIITDLVRRFMVYLECQWYSCLRYGTVSTTISSPLSESLLRMVYQLVGEKSRLLFREMEWRKSFHDVPDLHLLFPGPFKDYAQTVPVHARILRKSDLDLCRKRSALTTHHGGLLKEQQILRLMECDPSRPWVRSSSQRLAVSATWVQMEC